MGVSGGSSSQSSKGYGYSQSLAQSINQAFSSQGVYGAQEPGLKQMYGGASSLARQQSGQMGGAARRAASPGIGATTGALQQLSDISRTGGALGAYAKPNNALARQQVANLTANVKQQFNREILPSLRSGAGLAGGMGGSREALARGVAAGDAAEAISQGATDLYAQQYGIGAQAAAGATDARLSAASQIPTAGGALFDMRMSPYAAQWSPWQSMAQIFGGPTVLGQSGSRGLSQAQSQSEDFRESQGKSRDWGFQFF